jgi:hypothetical protein
MMSRSSSLKADIEKIKRLKALQEKATDKLNMIGEKASGKAPKKKPAKAAVKKKAKAPVKKESFWQKLAGKKRRTQKISKPPKTKNKKPGKKGPGSPSRANDGFIFRHFGRGGR